MATKWRVGRLALVLASGLVLEAAAASAPPQRTYAELPTNSVLVKVGSSSMTKLQFEELVAAKVALLKHKRPRVKADKLDGIRQNIRMREWLGLAPQMLLAEAAWTNGIAISPKEEAALRARYAQTYRKGRETLDQTLKKALTAEQRKLFGEQLRRDLLAQAYLAKHFAVQMAVSATDVSNQVAMTKAYNARAAATNALIFATASNILARARGGEDFGKLADKYSEDASKEPGGDMGFCAASDYSMDPPRVWHAIRSLKPGEITDVLETEDGIEIIKFLGDKDVDAGDETDVTMHLARILWRQPIIFDDDPEFLRQELRAERKRNAVAAALKGCRQTILVQFPNGEDIFKKKRNTKGPRK